MKQLYLSGAITNNPNYKQDFETAFKKLVKSGYSVVSPIIFCNDDWDWNTCMRKCLEILARNKNLSIALIENHYKSQGRDLELEVAKTLGLEIKPVDEWIKGARQ